MQKWLDRNTKWILTIPIILFILLMVAYPLVYTVRLSFNSWSMSALRPMKYVGLNNYIKMFQNPKFINACKLTLVYSLICVSIETLIGLSTAILLNREFRGSGIVRTCFLLPVVATPVAVAIVWKMIYDPALGIIAFLMKQWGMTPLAWLGQADTALGALMVVDIWEFSPTIMLICLGGLSGIPTDSLEAATIDGATNWQKLTRITLPLLSPTIMVAVMLRMVDSLKTYDQIYATTQGGPGTATQTINVLAYRQAFENFKFGEASATIVVFFLVLVIITALFNILRQKAVVDY